MATYTDARNLLRASKGTVDYPAAVGSAYRALGSQNLAARKYRDALDLRERQFGLQQEQFETGKEQWGKQFGESTRQFDTQEERFRDTLDALMKERDRRFQLAEKQEGRFSDYQDWQKKRFGIQFGAGTPDERVSSFWEPMGFTAENYRQTPSGQYLYGNEGTQAGGQGAFGTSGSTTAAPVNPMQGIPAGGWRSGKPGGPYLRALPRRAR
jgi:hypothetical protein